MHILEVETEFALFCAAYIPSCDDKSYKYTTQLRLGLKK